MAEAKNATDVGAHLEGQVVRDMSDETFISLANDLIQGSVLAINRAGVFNSIYYGIRKQVINYRKAFNRMIFPGSTLSWYASLIAAYATTRYLSDAARRPIERFIPGLGFFKDQFLHRGYYILVGGTAVWLAGTYVSRHALQRVLGYKGYLKDQPKNPSIWTKMFVLGVKVLRGFGTATTYSYQGVLPCMSVPRLSSTITRYLATMRPILDDAEYDRFERLADDFSQTIGPTLQIVLTAKSWWVNNYVSDWWERFVYLRDRSGLMINSNFYALGAHQYTPTHNQVARAAQLVFQMLRFKTMLEREQLPPTLSPIGVPVCMSQYARLFGTARIPGTVEDKIIHEPKTKSFAVLCKGHYYLIKCVDVRGRPLSALDFEKQIQWVMNDAQNETPSLGVEDLAAMTAGNRTEWAEFREATKGKTRASIEAIERAAFVLVLDEDSPEHPVDDVEEDSSTAHACIHGSGRNRWFDKSFNLIVFANGKCGLNVEHTWADAPIVAHLWEWSLAEEFLGTGYDQAGWNKRVPNPVKKLQTPLRLMFEFDANAAETLSFAYLSTKAPIDALSLKVIKFEDFSKGYIKSRKMSPDGFMQMCLQLAFYRDAGHFCQTYESAMMRMYRDGRTETIRSVTPESCAFVMAMENKDATATEKVALLRKATTVHAAGAKKILADQGVDRHLFCLYVASVWLGYDSEFLKEALGQKWLLSTSQTPLQTKKMDIVRNPDKVVIGGGFGPVAENGYGVSYIISSENHVFFHISCKKSSGVTDAARFARHIITAMREMRQVVDKTWTA